MKTIDRRRLIGAILCGAGSAMVLTPVALEAMPIDTKLPEGFDDFVEKAQTAVVRGRPPASPPLGLLVAQGPSRLRLALGVRRRGSPFGRPIQSAGPRRIQR